MEESSITLICVTDGANNLTYRSFSYSQIQIDDELYTADSMPTLECLETGDLVHFAPPYLFSITGFAPIWVHQLDTVVQIGN